MEVASLRQGWLQGGGVWLVGFSKLQGSPNEIEACCQRLSPKPALMGRLGLPRTVVVVVVVVLAAVGAVLWVKT